MKRIFTAIVAIVLAVGLLPAGAIAAPQGDLTGGVQAAEGDADALNPVGLQVNNEPMELVNYGYPADAQRWAILPSYVETGSVALAFEGCAEERRAPRIAMNGSSGSIGFITAANATSIAWANEAHTAGVVYFSAEDIKAFVEEKGFAVSDIRFMFPQANGGNVTVTRMVFTGMDPLPDVSEGGYGTDNVRRVYTRPVTIRTTPNTSPHYFRTTSIDVFNPVFEGADLAVRYTSPTNSIPSLQLCYVTSDNQWLGWTDISPKWGARTAVDEKTGERVTFYRRAEIEKRWREVVGESGPDFDHLFVKVNQQSSTYAEGAEECKLIEVVALNGATRINPFTDEDSAYQPKHCLTAEQIAADMKAGYNMAGHFESHYVPETPAKDGGWGQSDLASEAHWGRGIYITRETLHGLKEAGFNTIRLPTTWYHHIYPVDDPTGDCATRTDLAPTERYHIDRAWLDRVHEVVDWCIAEDMYVILNIHHEDWIDRQDLDTAYDETDLPVKFEAVWTQIANEFAGYDQHLVFEDMNEPHMWYWETNSDGSYKLDESGNKIDAWGFATEGTVSTVNRLNADFVKLMRDKLSGHADRLLMLAHDTGSGEISYTGFVMPDDPSKLVAHSVHCYTPHSWTHYLMHAPAEQTGSDNVYTDQYRQDVEAAWSNIRYRYRARGEVVILGEFGCFYQSDPDSDEKTAQLQQDRLDWMTQFATHAKELGIPLVMWRMDRTYTDENGAEHTRWSAFDEETHELSPLSADMIGKWFSILSDDSIAWNSLARVEEGEHVALDDGVQPAMSGSGLPATITGLHNSTTDWYVATAGSAITWSALDGNEIAVKFNGPTPRLGMTIGWKGDYWGVAPDSIDYDSKIAYWSSETIATRWKAVVAAAEKNKESGGSYEEALIGATENDINRLIVCTAVSGIQPPPPSDVSGATAIEQVSIVHRHEWGPWVTTGTTADGDLVQARTCEKDPTHVLERTMSTTVGGEYAPGHEWGAWTVTTPATCTEAGLETRVCKLYETHVETRVVAATGHTWDSGVVTTEPTEEAEGVRTFTCTKCKATRTEPIEKLPTTEPENPDPGPGGDAHELQTFGGSTRWETARLIAEAEAALPNAAYKGVIIAAGNEERFADALSAAGLSGALDYPIVIVNGNGLTTDNEAALDALRATCPTGSLDILIVGGTSAITPAVQASLSKWGTISMRFDGANRYETNARIYEYGLENGGWNGGDVFLATGANFPDALTIAPYLVHAKAPIVLASPKHATASDLPEESRAALKSASRVIALGGTATVSDAFLKSAASLAGVTTLRLEGANRYETSAAIVQWEMQQGMKLQGCGMATGKKFPDALASSYLLGSQGAVLCLVSPKQASNADMVSVLESARGPSGDATLLHVFGGTDSVSTQIRDQMVKALGWETYKTV